MTTYWLCYDTAPGSKKSLGVRTIKRTKIIMMSFDRFTERAQEAAKRAYEVLIH